MWNWSTGQISVTQHSGVRHRHRPVDELLSSMSNLFHWNLLPSSINGRPQWSDGRPLLRRKVFSYITSLLQGLDLDLKNWCVFYCVQRSWMQIHWGWHSSLTPREEYQHVLRELPLLDKSHERAVGFNKSLVSHGRSDRVHRNMVDISWNTEFFFHFRFNGKYYTLELEMKLTLTRTGTYHYEILFPISRSLWHMYYQLRLTDLECRKRTFHIAGWNKLFVEKRLTWHLRRFSWWQK